mmetsp:Transcript_17449/g.26687  ORF Transcript_17449/g.26687 Transcript_17449/m.26687 type:complete len:100 (+) Transcript_17449:587-886(+)
MLTRQHVLHEFLHDVISDGDVPWMRRCQQDVMLCPTGLRMRSVVVTSGMICFDWSECLDCGGAFVSQSWRAQHTITHGWLFVVYTMVYPKMTGSYLEHP